MSMCWKLKSLLVLLQRKFLTFAAQIIYYNLPTQYLFDFGQIFGSVSAPKKGT